MNSKHEITDIIARELDTNIDLLATDIGISETHSIKVLKDALVVTSIFRVSQDKEGELKEVVDSIVTPLFETYNADNIRVNKVNLDKYLGSLNT